VGDVNGDEKRLNPLPKALESNGLEEAVGAKFLKSFWQVDKSSSGSSKLISEEGSTVPDGSM